MCGISQIRSSRVGKDLHFLCCNTKCICIELKHYTHIKIYSHICIVILKHVDINNGWQAPANINNGTPSPDVFGCCIVRYTYLDIWLHPFQYGAFYYFEFQYANRWGGGGCCGVKEVCCICELLQLGKTHDVQSANEEQWVDLPAVVVIVAAQLWNWIFRSAHNYNIEI